MNTVEQFIDQLNKSKELYENNRIKEIDRINKLAKFQLEKVDILKEKLPSLIKALSSVHLEISDLWHSYTGNSYEIKDGDKYRVTIYAKSDGKFIFIKDQGYTASGAGRNQQTLDNKAKKIEEKLQASTGIDRIHVNPFSLEVSRIGNSEYSFPTITVDRKGRITSTSDTVIIEFSI